MMRRMLGAPLGGTARGGQYVLESVALSLITPPNGIGGGGICFPSIVTVASGEPGVPLICWPGAGEATNIAAAAVSSEKPKYFSLCFMVLVLVIESPKVLPVVICAPSIIVFFVRRFDCHANRTREIFYE